MSNIVLAQASKLAKTLGMEGEGQDLISTLKATAFKGQVSDAQMAALLMVANQYGLSPWTKEIYAFPDRNNGIVPVVGVDGWARIMNEHPQFDGLEFDQDDDGCTCRIFRKDRSRPIAVTEYMSECRRDGVGPWKSHPRRMLRHKAMIQCARLAFGFVGIYDQDEAERIREIDMGSAEVVHAETPPARAALSSSVQDADPQLVADIRAEASKGLKAYEAAWTSLTKEQRRSLTKYHEENKNVAAAADKARTIDSTEAAVADGAEKETQK